MVCTVSTDRLTGCVSLCILDMSVLQCNDYEKFLGMLTDKNLTWKPHIDHLASKISKMVEDTQMRKIMYFFDDVGSRKINSLGILFRIFLFLYYLNLLTTPSSGVVNSFA